MRIVVIGAAECCRQRGADAGFQAAEAFELLRERL